MTLLTIAKVLQHIYFHNHARIQVKMPEKKEEKEEKHHPTPHPGREETFFPHTNQTVIRKMQAEKKSSLHTLTKQ